MSPKIRGTEMFSHGFLEILGSDYIIVSQIFGVIFEKYMSPKICENIFQSHGSYGFHGFLEIYPDCFAFLVNCSVYWVLVGANSIELTLFSIPSSKWGENMCQKYLI